MIRRASFLVLQAGPWDQLLGCDRDRRCRVLDAEVGRVRVPRKQASLPSAQIEAVRCIGFRSEWLRDGPVLNCGAIHR